MLFFKTYYHKIVKYDLVNTFLCQKLTEIPELKKIVLNFGYQKSNLKYLISGLLALEFITSKKGSLTKSKHLNLFLKIKKGNPVGCKIVLKKNTMYFFYIRLITSIFSKAKQSPKYQFQWSSKSVKSISIQLKSPLLFSDLETQFQFFRNIQRLDITLVTNSGSQKELFFFLKSLKFFI